MATSQPNSDSPETPPNSAVPNFVSGSSSFDMLPGFAAPPAGGGPPRGGASPAAGRLPEGFDPRSPEWWPVIEGYIIVRWLAGGGFGCVYQAHNTILDCAVAIKILNPRWLGDAEAVERFVREVTQTAQNRSRHIVQVMNTGRIVGSAWNNCPYMAMEYLTGGDFQQWLSSHPRTSRRDPNLLLAVQKVAEVCEGLHALHEAGLIHRDIKPQNILLDQNEVPRLSDLGLAEVYDPRLAAAHSKRSGMPLPDDFEYEPNVSLTAADVIVGTQGYMAPELFVGMHNASPASDQYAMGVILYQILCDLRPFQNHQKDSGERQRIKAAAGQSESDQKPSTPPPPSSKGSFRDAGLQYICLKCLSPEPELRYRDVAALRHDLQRWLNGELVQDNPFNRIWNDYLYRPVKSRPLWYIGLTALALTFIGLIYGLSASLVYQTELSQRNRLLDAAVDEKSSIQNQLRKQLVDTLAVQGENMAASGDVDLAMLSWSAAWKADLGGSQPDADASQMPRWQSLLALSDLLQPQLQRVVPASRIILDAAYSADGQRLVLNEGNALTVVDPPTGQRLFDKLELPGPVRRFAISPDTSRVAAASGQYQGSPVLGLFDLQNGERQLVEIDFRVGDLAFTPDGKQLVVCSGSTDTENPGAANPGKLEVRDGLSLAAVSSVEFADEISCLAVHPDGSQIAVAHLGPQSRITIHAMDTLQELRSIPAVANRTLCTLRFSPDGGKLAAASSDGVVLLAEMAAPESAAITGTAVVQDVTVSAAVDAWGRHLGFVCFSADGQRLATACGDRTVRIWDPETRRECSPPLAHSGDVTAISFSADRNHIVTGSLEEAARIWDVTQAQPLPGRLRHRGVVLSAAFHPDGRTLYTAGEDGDIRFWEFQPQRPLQPEPETVLLQQTLSPDSKLLATQDTTGQFRVFDTQSLEPVSPHFGCSHAVHLLSFSADGSTLAMAGTNIDGTGRVSVVNARTGESLGDELPVDPLLLHLSFSPDGRWLAIISAKKSGKSLWIYDCEQQVGRVIEGLQPDRVVWHPVSKAELFIGSRESRILRISLPDFTARETGANGDEQVFRDLVFSPDGTMLAAVTGEAVRILKTASLNAPDPQLIKHEQEPNGAAFSGDNLRLLTWGADGIVQVWSRVRLEESWQKLGRVSHKAAVNSAAFNADGTLFASGSSDGTAAVWDTQSCQSAGPGIPHSQAGIGMREVHQVRFGPDGRSLLTSTENSDGLLVRLPKTLIGVLLPRDQRARFSTLQPLLYRSCMRVWNWKPDTLTQTPEAGRIAATYLSGSQIGENGRFTRLDPQQLREFLQTIPDSFKHAGTARQQLGRLLVQEKKFAEAAAEFRRAIRLAPAEDGLLWFEYGKALYEIEPRERVEEALAAFHKSEALGFTSNLLFLTRGRLLRDLARFEDALPDLVKSVEKSRLSISPGVDLANCLAELGRFDEAAARFDAAVQLSRTFLNPIRPMARYQRIVLEHARGNPAEAERLMREYLSEASESDDAFACYHAALAGVLTPAAPADRDIIVRLAEKAHEEFGSQTETSSCVAFALIRRGRPEDLERAEKVLQNVLAPGSPAAGPQLPRSPWGYYFQVLLYRLQNRPDEARKALETAERLHQEFEGQLQVPAVRLEFPWPRRVIIGLLAAEAKAAASPQQ